MSLEAGLIAYAALANIALARKKHRLVPPVQGMLPPSVARSAGIFLLLLSIAVAIVRFGGAQGVVAWTGQLCVAGGIFVLLLSWRARTALMLGTLALAFALPIAMLR